MKADEDFSSLIGRVYDCVLDSSLWPDVLREITEAVNGLMADIAIVNPIAGTGHLAAYYNWPDDVRDLVYTKFHISPAAPLALTLPLLVPMCSSRDLDIEAFHNSRYWKTCFEGRGYYDYLLVGLSRTVSQVGSWGVMGTKERGPFDDDSLELARLLSPHIQRAVQISGVLGFQRIQAGMLRSSLHALAAPAVIIEPDRTIRFRNTNAQIEFENGGIFSEVNGRLVGRTPDALKLLAQIVPTGQPIWQKGRDAILTDIRGRTLHVTWATLDQVGEEMGSSTLIFLREPEAELTLPVSAAARLYRLTNVETQVLAQVINGHSLSEAAQILGVARSTVKSHLDAIYRRTNTHRQAELVRLVMSLASPLSDPKR